MSKEMEFFIYLLENYAYYKKISADKILNKLIELNVFNKVFNNYEFYHIDSLENAYKDIDLLLKNSTF